MPKLSSKFTSEGVITEDVIRGFSSMLLLAHGQKNGTHTKLSDDIASLTVIIVLLSSNALSHAFNIKTFVNASTSSEESIVSAAIFETLSDIWFTISGVVVSPKSFVFFRISSRFNYRKITCASIEPILRGNIRFCRYNEETKFLHK